jgi:hypothetical protein
MYKRAMSQALIRIIKYADEFYEGVKRCRDISTYSAGDMKDAYNRLQRLLNRYRSEIPNLDPFERKPLEKVFEHDNLIKGLLDLRQIGEHVQKRTEAEVPLLVPFETNQRIPLTVETSAMAVFGQPIFTVFDRDGKRITSDHHKNLVLAEERIKKAINRALAADEKRKRGQVE